MPGWHGTIFAPYFVAGAIFSGIGMVLTLIIPLRRALRIEHMITEYHFDNLAKLTLLTGSILFYAYAMEYFVAWYSGNTFEQTTFFRRAFGPMWWAGWTMIICNAFVSQLLWFRKIRTNLTSLFVISIFINIGMWFERFVIIVSSLEQRLHALGLGPARTRPGPTGAFWPGSFGWFGMWFLLFAKNFPIVAIQEIKEMIPMPRKRAEGTTDGPARSGPARRRASWPPSSTWTRRRTRSARCGRGGTGTWWSTPPRPTTRSRRRWTTGESGAALHPDRRADRLRRRLRHDDLDVATTGRCWWAARPIASIPPYVVIAFELTILLGALSTVAAVALFSRAHGQARHRLRSALQRRPDRHLRAGRLRPGRTRSSSCSGPPARWRCVMRRREARWLAGARSRSRCRPAAATSGTTACPSPDDLWHVIPWFDHMIHARYVRPYETAARAALHAGGHRAGDRRRARLVGRVDDREDHDRPTRSGIPTRPARRQRKASPAGPTWPSFPREVDAAGDTLYQTYCAVCHGPAGDAKGPVSSPDRRALAAHRPGPRLQRRLHLQHHPLRPRRHAALRRQGVPAQPTGGPS